MTAPKKTGPRKPHPELDEGLIEHLSRTGSFELLSRDEEVQLAQQYVTNREMVRRLALESLVGARRFLQLTHPRAPDEPEEQSFWPPRVSHADVRQARHQLLLLEDRRRELHLLRARRSRYARILDSALASYTRSSRMALERLGVDTAFVEEVVRAHREVMAAVAEREPVTRELEATLGIDRDELVRSRISDPLRTLDLRRVSFSSAAELRRTLLEERRAVRELMDELDLDAEAVRRSQRDIEAAVRARDAARNRFVSANLRLVIWIARRYTGRGMPLTDLVQEGNLGLLTAIEKFDPSRGFRFSTYATWWIRQAVQRGLANRLRTIRLPVHIQEFRRQVSKTDRQLAQQLGRSPAVEELARASGSSVRKLERLRQVDRAMRSLNAPLSNPEGTATYTLSDTIEDGSQGSPEGSMIDQEREQIVGRLLRTLSERERYIIRQRFGVNSDAQRETLHTIAGELGITRERVRQIEHSALKKLKKHARLMDLRRALGLDE